jgi:hypothetical protein
METVSVQEAQGRVHVMQVKPGPAGSDNGDPLYGIIYCS